MIIGERFRAGGFKRWLYGSDYRDLWTTPIEVAVLDLDRVGGGLTPLRTGGAGQSISLHFTGEDGRRYTVRSLDKDPIKRKWDELKNTVVDDVLQDMISALLPTGALVVDPLMEATGILHAKHTLVVIPDDLRLKEYREEFAGLIGMLQEHPSEGPDDTPGFAGSRKISGTEKLWERLEKTPCNRVDARAYLKARLMDFLINDRDRHYGQWRWARFPAGDCYTWLPIPEDRDQAFVDLDGFGMAVARRGLPMQIEFDDAYPSLVGLSTTGWELDREFLVELNKTAWDSVVTAFRRDLPDPIIEDAVRKLPPPYYKIVGEALTKALKSRRDALPEFARRYYTLITREAEIQATDQDEYAHCEHLPSGDLSVRIGLMEGPDGARKTPYFQRTFHPQETREVRIYLRGGADRAEIAGAKGRIAVRIDGGGGDDASTNSSQASAAKTRFYDYRGKNRFAKGKGAKIDKRPYKRPPARILRARYALDWGMQAITLPILMANPDLSVFVGGLGSRQYFGYRKNPFSSSHSFNAGLAINRLKSSISYTGTFRQLLLDLDAKVHLKYSGIQVIRFNGLGNKTEIPESSSFYEVEQNYFAFAPSLEFRAGEREGDMEGMESLRSELIISLGPIIKYANTPLSSNKKKFIGSLGHPVYGTDSFGQVGAQGEIAYDTRNNLGYATRGFLVRVAGAIYPGVWDVESAFGSLDGETRAYLTARIPTSPTLALRAGGKKVWGTFPFHESAFLGGPGFAGSGISNGNLRGFRKNRFAGDTALYGNSELRLVLAKIKLLVPGELGLFGAADAGRVIFAADPDDADSWHTGVGGGLWLSFLRRRQYRRRGGPARRSGTHHSDHALVLAFGVTLPITWVYRWTRPRKKYSQSFAHTLLVIPTSITLVVFLVKGSLALAFSLAGIVAAVRFRTSLEEPMDAVYMFMAIGIGLAAGTQLTTVAYLASLVFVAIALGVWKSNFGARPAVISGWTILYPEKSAQVSETSDTAIAANKPCDAQIEVHAAKVDEVQKATELILTSSTKRWQVADVIHNEDGTAVVVFDIWLKKSVDPLSLVRDIEESGKGYINAVRLRGNNS